MIAFAVLAPILRGLDSFQRPMRFFKFFGKKWKRRIRQNVPSAITSK